MITLNNGVKMPQMGYGVYQVSPTECERCVLDAISVGYRMIDTAQAYHNEEGVGNAIKKCGVPREELFIVTKVWISNAGEEKAYASILESLKKLKSDYIDLLLIHQPFGDYYGTYRAMERAYREGKVRAIGVSNFYPWGPFAEGLNDFFHNEVLTEIGKAHGKTLAQTALRFLIQRGVIIIPKSTHKERMKENLDIFDFELTADEMIRIAALDLKHSLFFSHYEPKMVEQFMLWEKLSDKMVFKCNALQISRKTARNLQCVAFF